MLLCVSQAALWSRLPIGRSSGHELSSIRPTPDRRFRCVPRLSVSSGPDGLAIAPQGQI